MPRELLFSVRPEEFTVEFMRGHGNGGQNRNKRDTACRITHKDSGAVGYSQDQRSQLQNKRQAFKRLTSSTKFTSWLARKAAMLGRDLEAEVERDMRPENLRIEYGKEFA